MGTDFDTCEMVDAESHMKIRAFCGHKTQQRPLVAMTFYQMVEVMLN